MRIRWPQESSSTLPERLPVPLPHLVPDSGVRIPRRRQVTATLPREHRAGPRLAQAGRHQMS